MRDLGLAQPPAEEHLLAAPKRREVDEAGVDVLDDRADAVDAVHAARDPDPRLLEQRGERGELLRVDRAAVARDPRRKLAALGLCAPLRPPVLDELLDERPDLLQQRSRLLGREVARHGLPYHQRVVAAGQSRAEAGATRPDPRVTTGRLAGWIALVGLLAALNYVGRFSGETTPDDVLYQYSTAASALVLFAVMIGVVFALARPDLELLALRRPRSWGRAAGQMFGVLIMVYVIGLALSPFLDPGEEQGLTPDRWDSSRAAPFFVNAFVVVVVAPFVEELTFRGLGYSLLAQLGAAIAIAGTAIGFALGHGLLEGLPVLFAFGAGLAYIRFRQDSVIPGMLLHGIFNAIALSVSVST